MTAFVKTIAASFVLATLAVGTAGAMDSMGKMSPADCMKKAQMEKDPSKMAAMQKDCHAPDAMKASGAMMKKPPK